MYNAYTTALSEIMRIFGNEYEIHYHTPKKADGTVLHGVEISDYEAKLRPIIYYDHYIGKLSSEQIAERVFIAYRHMRNNLEAAEEVAEKLYDFEAVREYVSIGVVGLFGNLVVLGYDDDAKSPYEEFLDFAILVIVNLPGNLCVKVTNGILKRWGREFAEVLQIAKENYYATGAKFKSMREMLEELGEPVTPELECLVPDDVYVLTGSDYDQGVGFLANKDVMEGICRELKGDIVAVPLNVHEVYIHPYRGEADVQKIAEAATLAGKMNGGKMYRLGTRPYIYRAGTGWEL